MDDFARQISRELGSIDSRLESIEKDTALALAKIELLKDSMDKRVNNLAARIYTISGGIAVFGATIGLLAKKLLGE